MCWQDSPGNRASLRELRIMLLHLHSASRGDPDTASFDQKWNQLMPRQPLPNAEDPSAGSGNNSARSQVVDIVDIDLGTISGNATQPDFLEPKRSPDDIKPPVTSNADNLAMPPSTSAQSPVNEMSLAAELGALGMFEGPSNDDTKYVSKDGAENSHTTSHISVLAEVHSEKTDGLNVPLYKPMDITDQFSSLNAEPVNESAASQAETYASYLKTVNTSVVEGDDDMVYDPKSSSEVFQSSDPDDKVNDSP